MNHQTNPSPSPSVLESIGSQLIEATNSFDVERALRLFSTDAAIDDPSVGQVFRGPTGLRTYLERYFVGYHTKTTILEAQIVSSDEVQLKVDFVGDFGHEIGRLDIRVAEGLVVSIHADLD